MSKHHHHHHRAAETKNGSKYKSLIIRASNGPIQKEISIMKLTCGLYSKDNKFHVMFEVGYG
jgi:hypothetical protein